MKEALELIVRKNKQPEHGIRQVSVCVAPPYRKFDTSEMDAAIEKTFTAMVKKGETPSTPVTKCW